MPDPVLQELLPLRPRQLIERLRGGHAIDPDALDGRAYLGIALGMPAWVDRLAWKTFQKAFARDAGGELRGWNVRLKQHGLDAPCEAMVRRGRPFTFGHFRVISPTEYGRAMPRGTDAGLLIDYGLQGKPFLDVTRHLRDPIVALRPGDPDTLLGWSYLQIGRRAVPTPSFFLLTRPEPIAQQAA